MLAGNLFSGAALLAYRFSRTYVNFRYNLQERRKGCSDVCEDPLFSDVDDAMFEVPTIKTLLALHDNYEPVGMK